jgi:excisionase family DNA binding protein
MKSVSEVAQDLEVSSRRVRALASEGRIDAHKIGGRWLVHDARDDRQPGPGRPVSAANAWAILAILSRDPPDWLSSSVRSRLRRRLREPGWLESALEFSQPRSLVNRLEALPGDLKKLQREFRVVRSGLAANYPQLDVLPSSQILDAYVNKEQLGAIKRRFLPDEDSSNPNLILRVPSNDWVLRYSSQVPVAVAAADLLEEGDPRVRRAALSLLGSTSSW